MKFSFVLISLLIGWVSCVPDSLTGERLESYLSSEKEGASKVWSNDQVKIKAIYQPSDLMAFRQIQIMDELESDSLYQALVQEYSRRTFFHMQIEPVQAGLTAKDLFDANSTYFNFEIAKELFLLQDTDTIPCITADLERSIGLKPTLNFYLAFDKPVNQDFSLLFKGYGSKEGSPVKFNYSFSAIHSIPKLKY